MTGKPEVTVTWKRDGSGIPDGDFQDQIDTVIPLTDGPYDLTEGVNSALPWIKQGAEATCDTLTKYDGNYRCVARNNGDRESSSAAIKLETRCEFNYTLFIFTLFYSTTISVITLLLCK